MPTTSRIPLGRAHMLASAVIHDARRAGLAFESLTPVGSVRRFAPDIGDVSLLGVAPAGEHPALLDGFARLRSAIRVLSRSAAHVTGDFERGAVTLHLADREHAGAALVWHTGSVEHTRKLQARASRQGLTLDRAQLSKTSGTLVPTLDEEMVYRHLGLQFIPPELREGENEIDIAAAGGLPALVSEIDIRGDLHMHSTWSDGRDAIADMVAVAQQLGYEYVAITDHSERSLASRKLAASDIPRQRREIEKIRKRASGIEVLHGIEVDIMHDGSLDFDDQRLEGFDIVLASLHDHQGHDASTLAGRYLRAIYHPLVNVITHPANRSPGRSIGYDVDFDRLFAAAAETGTAMEIDGAPGHLDMDGALARRAIARGVTVVINSDCHRADALARQMRFGLGTARRGWIERSHVLNTRPIDEIRSFVARKRGPR
jgi:DNA polymerase (family 10)